MSINFIPKQNTYSNLGAFRYWCQKVLPLVYDDSLSYYELLCKVVNYLNETIENVDLMGDDIQKLYTAYEELHNFVDGYFTNLDVQHEINNKLDSMAKDGSLSVLIQPLFDVYKREIDAIVAEQNAEIGVLKTRMNTFTTLQNDSTTGDAELADARVDYTGKEWDNVGEHVREVTNQLSEQINEYTQFTDEAIFTQKKSVNLVKQQSYIQDSHLQGSNGALIENENIYSIIIPIKAGELITIDRSVSAYRGIVYTTQNYPQVNEPILREWNNLNDTAKITTIELEANENYLVYYYGSQTGANNGYDIQTTRNGIRVYYGDKWISENSMKTSEVFQPLLKDVMNLMGAVNITEETTNIFDYENASYLFLVANSEELVNSSTTKSTIIPIEPNRIVCIEVPNEANRFSIATTSEYPKDSVKVNQFCNVYNEVGANVTKYVFVTDEHSKYIVLSYFSTSSETTVTEEYIQENISVVYGTSKGEENRNRLSTPNEASMLMLNDNMINLLSYRQLGTFSRGYIAMSCDDGRYPLATYVLPKLFEYENQYNVSLPLTMGLAIGQGFDVFDNENYLNIIKNALNNHNCSIGIHGDIKFTNYTRKQFLEYLSKQKEGIKDITGNYPTSVLYVSDGVNKQVMTIAGSFFEVCGSIPTATGETYAEWCNSPRSNIFALKRFSLLNVDITDEDIENAIDYAYEHNLILCPYWHDINFEEEISGVLNTQQAKARFEHFLQYAINKGIKFINFGDIPTLEVY